MANSESSDIKSLVSSYNKNMKTLLDKHAPLITRSFVEWPFCPWMTDEIKEARKARSKCEATWRKTKLTIHREMYQDARLHLKLQINNAKTNYYTQLVDRCQKDQRSLFHLIHKLTSNATSSTLPQHESSEILAKNFSDFFINKIEKIQEGLAVTAQKVNSSLDCNLVLHWYICLLQ